MLIKTEQELKAMERIIATKVADIVAEKMAENNISLSRLARLCNLHPMCIKRLLEKRNTTRDTIARVICALDINIMLL